MGKHVVILGAGTGGTLAANRPRRVLGTEGGHFPGPVGLPLLKESRLNHLGKLMFAWLNWHVLLPGRENMAPEIAREVGVGDLTDRHWQVIEFMRTEYAAKGTGPTVRVLGKSSGVSVKELYQLFPKGPAKLAAGIPKPRGRI
jgi:tRNA 2-thiouridine synthesizing protein E